MTTFPHSLRKAWAAPNSKALSEQALQAGAKGSAARSHYFGGTFSNQSQLPRRRYFHSSKNKSPPIPALASCLPLVSLCMLIGWTCTALHKFQPLWTPLFYSRPNPHGKQAQTFCRTDKRRSNSGQNHLSVQWTANSTSLISEVGRMRYVPLLQALQMLEYHNLSQNNSPNSQGTLISEIFWPLSLQHHWKDLGICGVVISGFRLKTPT